MPADLIPDLSVTVAPSVALTALAWALHWEPAPRHRLGPGMVPASEIARRLSGASRPGTLVAIDRSHVWTVTCDRCGRCRSWCGCELGMAA